MRSMAGSKMREGLAQQAVFRIPIKPRTLIRAQERQRKLRRKLDARAFQRMGIAEGPANPAKRFRPNP
jgi:hypothetical protein